MIAQAISHCHSLQLQTVSGFLKSFYLVSNNIPSNVTVFILAFMQ